MADNNLHANQPRPAINTRTVTAAAADGGRCAVTTVDGTAQAGRAPVIMLPGMFTGRRFWLSDKHIGLAAYIAEQGHPVFIVQRRGLSDSPASSGRAGLEEHVRHDLPAVQALVAAQYPGPAFWIGHSFGGIMAARAGAQSLDPVLIAGWVLFATQFEVRKIMLDWPGHLLTRAMTRLYGRLPAKAAGLGPEDEPIAAVHDATDWVARGRRHPALRNELGTLTQPVVAISGAGDRVDPGAGCERFIGHFASADRTFISAGKASGYSEDYDHPGIVISKPAQREIWPLVVDWMAAHAPATDHA